MMTRDARGRPPAWRRYLRFWRRDPARDVDDELRFHLESAADELVAAGWTQAAARDAAERRFGNVRGIQATLYHLSERREQRMRMSEWLDTIRQDVVYGVRQLRRSPGFTAVAVLTLALGIGANSAIFSVVYSVLLNPLPYANGNRIVTFAQQNGVDPERPGCGCMPFGNFYMWQRESNAFEAMGASWGQRPATLTGIGEPLSVANDWVSAGYWEVLYIPPVLGRYFSDDEDREGGPRVAVISYALWQSHFKGSRDVVGQTITLNSVPTMVIGVAPPQYILAPPAEVIWTPLAPPQWRFSDFSDHELSVYGLLKPGMSVSAATAQLTAIDTRLAKAHPHSGYDGGVVSAPLTDAVVGPQRTLLYMLLGAVALVLLIACVNIANLLLARATARRPEIAIRGALGATRSRMVMQLLVESVLLAVAGGVVGLGVGMLGMRFLLSSPVQIPRLQQATINGPVLTFTILLTALCAILFGLLPALRASRLDLQQTLRDAGRESQAAARTPLRGMLVVAELALAQVLLIGAGLLIHSSILLQSVPAGFDTRNLLAFSLNLPGTRYANSTQTEAAYDQMTTAIAATPGVRAVGRTQVAPIYGGGWNWPAMREGSNGHDDGSHVSDMRGVSPGYFSTIGLRLLRGREFTTADGANAPLVAIISRQLAKALYGDADPIGKRISNGSVEKPNWREVVGVVDDMHADGLGNTPPMEMYMPTTQFPQPSQTILVRGNVPVTTLLPQIRRAVAVVDPLLAFANVETMDGAVARTLALPHFTMWLLTLLGITGLALAVVGVYGVIAYFVTQRTHELGIRMALGATGPAIQWMVVRQGLVFGVVGVVVGSAASLLAARMLRTMVFGITTRDPATFVVVAAVLALVAVAASYLPARRATRIDPLEALRST